MIRAIIFDCFGVIITDALKVVVDELWSSDPDVARQLMDTIRAHNRGLIERTESNRRTAQLLGTTVEEWRARIDKGETKDEQLLAYIRELRQKYKTALLSNISTESLHRRFSDEELYAHFDAITVSGELGIVKPEPEIYLHAARQLGVEPNECVMIDDREGHCAGAEAVGMQAILYRDFGHAKQELERLLKQV